MSLPVKYVSIYTGHGGIGFCTKLNSFSDDFSFSLASPVKHMTFDVSVTLFSARSFVLEDENVSMWSLALNCNS